MTQDQFEKLAEMMKNLNDHVDERIDVLQDYIDKRFTGIDNRFSEIDHRFDKIDSRIDGHGRDLAELIRKVSNLEGFAVEIKDHESKLKLIESKIVALSV